MKKLGKENEKPLSVDKLVSADLLAFAVPQNTTFVVGYEDDDGDRVTGFLNSDKELVGWGLRVGPDGETEEAVWDGEGDYDDGVEREVGSTKNAVHKQESIVIDQSVYTRSVLGRENYSDGRI